MRITATCNHLILLLGGGRLVGCLRVLRVQRAAGVRSGQLCLQVGDGDIASVAAGDHGMCKHVLFILFNLIILI